MLTLCIDTAYKYLTCALIKDDEIVSSYSKECFKRQSEEVFKAIDHVFKNSNYQRKDIDSICISKGPGSYTGVRIAMSIAKTIGEVMPCDVYTISTMRLYAANRPYCMVVMDARANRVYCGIYNEHEIIFNDKAVPINQIDANGYELIGDGYLFGKEDNYGDIPKAFLDTKSVWEKVGNIGHLTPEYLKESEEYLK